MTQGRFNVESAIHVRMHIGQGERLLPCPRYHCHRPYLSHFNEEGVVAVLQSWDWGSSPNVK